MSKENTKPQGEKRVESLSKAVLGMLAVGLGGGIALIAAAKKVGDAFLAEEDLIWQKGVERAPSPRDGQK